MTKEFLSSRMEKIPMLLPHGAITQLTEEFGIHRLTVNRMLEGWVSDPDKVQVLYQRAKEVIREDIRANSEGLKQFEEAEAAYFNISKQSILQRV